VSAAVDFRVTDPSARLKAVTSQIETEQRITDVSLELQFLHLIGLGPDFQIIGFYFSLI